MNIHYGTVTLRAIEEEDLYFCQDMINSAYLEGNSISQNMPVSKHAQKEWFMNYDRKKEIRLMIDNNHGSIGMIMLTSIDWINRSGEAGIKLGDLNILEKRNTLDAVMGFAKYLFEELNFHCIYAYVLEENLLSRKLLIENGFREEGILRGRVFKRGTYHNLVSYSILEEEYKGMICNG